MSRSAGKSGANTLVPVNANIDGGTVPIGSSAQVVVLFRNEGGRPVNTGEINLYPSSNVAAEVSLNQCSLEPLLSGAECAIALSVKGMQPGAWRVDMLMRHDGRSRLVTASLSGSVEGSADGANKMINDIEAVPGELDFGTLEDSMPMLRSILLRNNTSNPIEISEISAKSNPSSGFSYSADCQRELRAGEGCVVTVTWSPKQRGPASGALIVKHSGPTGVTSVDLEGEFGPDAEDEAEIFPEAVPGKGLMVSNLSEIDFGSGVSNKAAITVSLVNVGDAPLEILEIATASSDTGLTVEEKGCVPGRNLEPIEACPLTLTWAPVRAGDIFDDVKIGHTGTRGILILPVRGSAAEAVSNENQALVVSGAGGGSRLPGMTLGENGGAGVAGSGESVAEQLRKMLMGGSSGGGGNFSSSSLGDFVLPGVTNKSKALDGYRVTSLAVNRAVISGPGGSRVVFNGEDVVLGGVLWMVDIHRSGVRFSSDGEKVVLLFDRSLSSLGAGASGSQSSSSSGSSESSGPASEIE